MEAHGKQLLTDLNSGFGYGSSGIGSTMSQIARIIDPWLYSIDRLLPKDGRYWYLAGPMSGLPGYNYPEFERVADILRAQDYNIVSPHEFEHESHRKRIAEADGHEDVGAPWQDCLARDVAVVSNPRCLGVILIDGWEDSKGANLETHVADALGKPLFKFSENPLTLTMIDRAEAMNHVQLKVRQYGLFDPTSGVAAERVR